MSKLRIARDFLPTFLISIIISYGLMCWVSWEMNMWLWHHEVQRVWALMIVISGLLSYGSAKDREVRRQAAATFREDLEKHILHRLTYGQPKKEDKSLLKIANAGSLSKEQTDHMARYDPLFDEKPHCSYNTNHWPCTYCKAANPQAEDAKCKEKGNS